MNRLLWISIFGISLSSVWADGKMDYSKMDFSKKAPIDQLRTELVPFSEAALAEAQDCSYDYAQTYLCDDTAYEVLKPCDYAGLESSAHTLELTKPVRLSYSSADDDILGFSNPKNGSPPYRCRVDREGSFPKSITLASSDYKEVTFQPSMQLLWKEKGMYEWKEEGTLSFKFPVDGDQATSRASFTCYRVLKTKTDKAPPFDHRSFFETLNTTSPKIRKVPKDVCRGIKSYRLEKQASLLEFLKNRPKPENAPNSLSTYLSLAIAENDRAYKLGDSYTKGTRPDSMYASCVKGTKRFAPLPTTFYAKAEQSFDPKLQILHAGMSIAATDGIEILEKVELLPSASEWSDSEFKETCGTHYVVAIEYGDINAFGTPKVPFEEAIPKEDIPGIAEDAKELQDKVLKKGGAGKQLTLGTPGKELDQSFELLFQGYAEIVGKYSKQATDAQKNIASAIASQINSETFLKRFVDRPDPRDRRPAIYRLESYKKLREKTKLPMSDKEKAAAMELYRKELDEKIRAKKNPAPNDRNRDIPAKKDKLTIKKSESKDTGAKPID